MGGLLKQSPPVAVDGDGFLLDPEGWNERLAQELATAIGIERLDPVHWAVIHTLREHFHQHHAPPSVGHVCHTLHLDEGCLETLFHGSREAWRLAGLPNPGEEAKVYM